MLMHTVLVVDDSPDLRSAIEDFLTSEGYRVVTAADGGQALRMLRGHRPSLMLTDLSMPILDGWELLQTLRRDPELADIPAVAYTSTPHTVRADLPPEVPVIPKSLGSDALLGAIRAQLAHFGQNRRRVRVA